MQAVGRVEDATATAAELYSRIRAMEKSLPENVSRILNFGMIQSGTVRNAISGHAHMEGSLRAYDEAVFRTLYDGIFALASQVEQQTGCRITVTMNDGYPAVCNPAVLFEKAREAAPFNLLESPWMTAEDFSWYQKRADGLFFFLGIGDTPALHAKDFDFDDSILVKGADFFEKLAENFQ